MSPYHALFAALPPPSTTPSRDRGPPLADEPGVWRRRSSGTTRRASNSKNGRPRCASRTFAAVRAISRTARTAHLWRAQSPRGAERGRARRGRRLVERAIVRASVDEFVDVHGLPQGRGRALAKRTSSSITTGCTTTTTWRCRAPAAPAGDVARYAATSARDEEDGADAPIDFADRVIVPPEHLAARYYGVLYGRPPSPQGEFRAEGQAFSAAAAARGSTTKREFQPAFVLGCLQRTNKLDPDAFDDWMNAASGARGAVVARPQDDAGATQAEAAARGVNPRRLHFANRVDKAGYLERLAASTSSSTRDRTARTRRRPAPRTTRGAHDAPETQSGPRRASARRSWRRPD